MCSPNSKNPARKSRSRTRKPKFLSLRLELSPENSQSSTRMTSSTRCKTRNNHSHTQKQQLDLFPLHPAKLVEDRDVPDENVAFLFTTDGNASLHGLLAADTSTENTISASSSEDSPTCGVGMIGRRDSDCNSLLRTAMRNRERDASEDKWVFYSEVVEKKETLEVEEVSSCGADLKLKMRARGLLSLKLDYQGIMNAWSGDAPLFMKGESPQTVPDICDDHLFSPGHDLHPNGATEGSGGDGNLLVPEIGREREGSRKMAMRKASVLRYKEKRQSRLFSKRIRYEVRKLNAEKRPRVKGRFVKRD